MAVCKTRCRSADTAGHQQNVTEIEIEIQDALRPAHTAHAAGIRRADDAGPRFQGELLV